MTKQYHEFVGFLMRSALTGIAAGLVGVAFRLALSNAEMWRDGLLLWAHRLPGWGWLVLPAVAAVALAAAGWLTGRSPEAAGSGIPQVEAVLAGERDYAWWRVLFVKFIGGLLALGSGLSLGREGPTVQMGAAVSQGVSKALGRPRAEELQLIACGAGAGLAAAFNAPLAGVLFVIEELRRNFSPYVLGGALAASITADIVSQAILGPVPTFRVALLRPLPLSSFPLILALGILAGLLGAAFNGRLQDSLALADRLQRIPLWVRASAIGFIVGLAGYFLPQVLGGGHSLVVELMAGQIETTLVWLVFLFAAKFLLTMVCYGAGVPGGIFLPLLSLGAILGALVARASAPLFPLVPGFGPSFVIIGMAAYFVAVVRAPVTGIVLITEMTGRYQHMLPLLLACVTAYVVAEATGSLPVYESLLQRYLGTERSGEQTFISIWGGTAAVEMPIESGARAAGRQVRELELPAQCLLAAVMRGSREVIPRGNTGLREGDVLRVIAPEESLREVRARLEDLTSCRLGCAKDAMIKASPDGPSEPV